jgi:hypothetical protein
MAIVTDATHNLIVFDPSSLADVRLALKVMPVRA